MLQGAWVCGHSEASIRNDVMREKWKKHLEPIITAGCLRLDWVSDSSSHLGLHLQSVPDPSVAKLQHRFDQIKPLGATWREGSTGNWRRILGRPWLPCEDLGGVA